ncbi:MAG: hypothetical protein ACXVEF_22695 [Polyangiales bacterium]
MKERQVAVRRVISRARWASVGIAAALSPIPLADELVFLGLYAWMTKAIAKAHGLATATTPWRPIGQTVLTGLLARAGLNLAFAAVPGVAAVANAASAAALTEALGRYTDEACAQPESARAVGLRWFNDHFERANATRA